MDDDDDEEEEGRVPFPTTCILKYPFSLIDLLGPLPGAGSRSLSKPRAGGKSKVMVIMADTTDTVAALIAPKNRDDVDMPKASWYLNDDPYAYLRRKLDLCTTGTSTPAMTQGAPH